MPKRRQGRRERRCQSRGKKKDKFKLAEAIVFETGTNQWRHYDSWPPKNASEKTLYLHAGGKLSFDPPAAKESGSGFDEYVSDPAKPVPYIGEHRHRHDPRTHARRSAVRLVAARRAGLSDATCWTTT